MPELRRAFILLFVLLALALPLAAQNTTIRGQVTLQADGAPIAGVVVSTEDGAVSAVTDADGRYELSVPSARGAVRVTAALQGFQSRTATVDVSGGGDVTRDFALTVSFGQEITVGSRAIGAESEKAVPVDVFTQEQIATSPSTETNQILQKMAPSFNFPRPTITDGTDTVRPATLRGLGPDQLLVMVNGKRRHASALVNANNSVGRGSSGVDLNAIPASAIDSVEILREGAAAQYGSDAIAGVINLVLKSDAQPLRIEAKYGATTHGDGEVIDASINGGWNLGRGVLFTTFEYRNRYETNRADPDPRDQIVAGDAGNNAVSQPNHHWGDSYMRDLIAFANFNLPLTTDGKQIAYAFGGFSNRHGSHGGFYRRALQAQNIPSIYPLGFLPLIEPRVIDGALTAGVRGEMTGWFYDLSAGYGKNEFDFYVRNSLNTSLGPVGNQTSFYAGTLGDDQLTANLDVSRQYRFGGLAGPVNVAIGAEFRRDGYEIQAGEPNSYRDGGMPDQFGNRAPAGAQVFPGFRPSNEIDTSRNSKAVYVDLEGDVFEQLRVGVAGRFEDYSDFGSTSNGKLTLRYSPMQKLIFRAAASTGFRAPSLSQSYFSAVSTNFLRDPATGQLAPFEVGTYPVNSPIALALGATPLEPETSRNMSAGVVFQPLANLEITADYFRIDIDDRIVFSGNFTGPQVLPLIQPFGVTGARFFTNAIDTRTRGFDVVANYQRGLASFGRIDLSAAYSQNKTRIDGVVATPPQLAGLSEVLFDRIERRRVECGQPKNNIRLLQSWNYGGLNVTARESRYGEYCSFTLLPADDQTYGAEWLTDLEGSYKWSSYRVAVGVENLFDVFPDRNRLGTPQANFGIFTYPSQSPFGMNGRFVYTRLSYEF
ncbi:MAG TPA: TonB-dependent receptor [Thermoanaerobaculia bacterium]|nr:TonB-dependent receptor [Thermoanaerobaculia bacterium]